MADSLQPWEMEKDNVEILKEYDAKIIAETDTGYAIEFYDYDSSLVEDVLPKEKFVNLPYPVVPGSHFWIVTHRIKGQRKIKVSVWPVAAYWHSSWYGKKEDPDGHS